MFLKTFFLEIDFWLSHKLYTVPQTIYYYILPQTLHTLMPSVWCRSSQLHWHFLLITLQPVSHILNIFNNIMFRYALQNKKVLYFSKFPIVSVLLYCTTKVIFITGLNNIRGVLSIEVCMFTL